MVLLRELLLSDRLAEAGEVVAALLPERRVIPDVVLKAGMHVLRDAGARDHRRQCQRFLRNLAKSAPQPRAAQAHLELVRHPPPPYCCPYPYPYCTLTLSLPSRCGTISRAGNSTTRAAS